MLFFYIKAFAKIIRLIDLYSSMQEQLSKKESVEFIKKIKYTLPFVIKQLQKFLTSLNQMINLNEQQRRDLAEYLVPEIDTINDFLLSFIDKVHALVEKVANLRANEKSKETSSATSNSNNEEDEENFDFDDSQDEESNVNESDESSNKKPKKNKFKNKLEKSIAKVNSLSLEI